MAAGVDASNGGQRRHFASKAMAGAKGASGQAQIAAGHVMVCTEVCEMVRGG